MLSWIFIVLAHWNNSPWVDMLLHSDTLSWFRANQSLLFLVNTACLRGEATNTNFIVFGLTLPGFEQMIYCTRGENANNYATDAVLKWYAGSSCLHRMVDGFYTYLCNRCLLLLRLWHWFLHIARFTWYNFLWWFVSDLQ